jgi:hypothetical protein
MTGTATNAPIRTGAGNVAKDISSVTVTVLKGLYLGLFPYCKGAVKESCTYFIDLFGCHVEFLGDLVEAHALVKTTKDIRFKAAHFHEGIVLAIKCCERGNIGRVKDPAIPTVRSPDGKV